MIMLILAPLVGVLGALLLAYGAWLIYLSFFSNFCQC